MERAPLRSGREALRGEVGRGARGGPGGDLRILAEDGHPVDACSQEAGRHGQVELEEGDFCC